MVNIIDPRALKFSNELVRPSADRMAQSYYLAVAVRQRWASLGSGQAALDQMQLDLANAANKIISTFDFIYWAEKNWNNGISALFPNDASPVFDNGAGTAQDPTRPALTGAMVNNIITRCMEFQNWLLSATGSFTDSARGAVAWLNTVIKVGQYGPVPIVLADAGDFINRCSELKTNYEAATNANLNTILAAAVNPNS